VNHWPIWITSAIFVFTYAGLAFGKVPGTRIDRAGIAYVGAALILCAGMLSFSQATAPDCIDYNTLFLLLGMMIVVAFLRISGAFAIATEWALARVRSPHALLGVVIVLSGVFSAFLVNDVVCLAITPVVLHLARRLKYDPLPHLIGVATAANIGSASTITGNPQNMIIGSESHIGYGSFFAHLAPVSLIGLAIDFGVIALVYRRALLWRKPDDLRADKSDSPPNRKIYRWLQIKSVTVAALTILLFFTGLPIALVATGAAAALLCDVIRPQRIYREIEWTLLLMFVGLFIVVHAFDVHVVRGWHVEQWRWLLDRPVDALGVTAAALSNLVSNVPAVLLFKPVMRALPAASQQTGWLALAMSSTFAGNFTVLGSVANLIVVEHARSEGVEITFWEYCKSGIPVTILTLAVGIGWLLWKPY
jgi:Na+/H+ antiporter NhaD/arsenite permease-like protein